MDFVAGLSLCSLAPGMPLSLSVLQLQDPSCSLALEEHIDTAPQGTQTVQSAFKRLADSKSLSRKKISEVVFTLPIYFTDEERQVVFSSAKAAGWSVPRKPSDFLDHAQTYLRASVEKNYAVQNELILDLGPSAAGSRLVSAEVEEHIRISDVISESIVRETDKCDVDELVHRLVDPALAVLQATPSAAGSTLKRIIIVDSISTILPRVLEQLHAKFSDNPSLQVIIASEPRQYAVKLAYTRRRFWDLAEESGCIFNTAVLCIGVGKLDGFVFTLLPRNFTLPNCRSVVLATLKDNQTKAKVQVVAGVSPRLQKNTVVAELVLEGLTPRPKGTTLIRVTLDVDQMGKTKVRAEEVATKGEPSVQKSLELTNLTGDMTEDDIDAYWNGDDIVMDEEAVKVEALWAGKTAQGELPE